MKNQQPSAAEALFFFTAPDAAAEAAQPAFFAGLPTQSVTPRLKAPRYLLGHT